jgi:hypothetical protein
MPRPWDTRVVYVEKRQRWWWNAYLPERIELSGFADSEEEAREALARAIEAAEPSR